MVTDVLEIVQEYLTTNGYDGLVYSGECACLKDDLARVGRYMRLAKLVIRPWAATEIAVSVVVTGISTKVKDQKNFKSLRMPFNLISDWSNWLLARVSVITKRRRNFFKQ